MPQFDPSQPFEIIDEAAPEFDPSAPFEVLESAAAPSNNTSPSTRAVVPSPFESKPAPQRPLPQTQAELYKFNAIENDRRLAEINADTSGFSPEELSKLDRGLTEGMAAPHPALEVPMVSREDILKRFPQMTEGNAGILAGVLQTAGNAWNFMASPFGMATAPLAATAGLPGAAGLVGKSVLGGFAAEAALNEPKAIQAFDEAVRSGDPEKIAQTASQLALNSFVAIGASKGMIDTAKAPKAQVFQAAREGVQSGLPQSAAALENVAKVEAPPIKAESSMDLGIAPEGSTAVQRAIERFTPPTPAAIPELRIEKGARLPRLQPYETEKLLASSPEGMARVPVLGALMDPRATAKTAPDAAILARAYSTHKGRTFAALWGESQFRNKDIFLADESTGTIPLTNGERGYMSDVIEAEIRDPGSQAITPQQRQWINEEWLPLREEVNKMLVEEGVREIATEDLTYSLNDYFPRPAVGKRNREVTPTGQTGGRPGSTPFFEKSRKYKTEFEGARPPRVGEKPKEEIIYDPDAISRAMKLILGAYKSVADHRLSTDVSLGGQLLKERVAELQSKHGEKLSMMDAAERSEFEAQLVEEAAYPIWGKVERVDIAPAFRGKIFPVETARKLRKAYAEDVRGWVRTASTITGAAKSLVATADMSAPLIQGAAMMGRNPARWAKATANSYRSLLDPDVMGKILEKPEYKTAAEEFSQAGGSLLQLEDFLSGMKKGSPTSKIPVFGKVVEATGRAYGVFLDTAKLELWRAWTKGVPTSEWGRVAEAIENSLFIGRMEKIGLNPHRAIGERLMAFAPAYYRGAGGLVSTAFQRGVQGDIARNMLAGYATAGLMVTVGSLLALGMSWDEIQERLDPTKGTFMKVPIESGDGTRVEVGVGNVLTQIVRLMGQAADYHLSEKPIDTGVENNPYLRFLRGRSALIPSLGIEIVTGRDYFGNRIPILEAIARRFMPFALQAMFPREPIPPGQRVMDSAFSFFGLNAFPESEYAAQLRHLDESVKAKGGGDFLSLPLNERALAVKEFKERSDYKKREPTVTDMERFIHINERREIAVRNRLTDATKKRLDEMGLSSSGYKSTVTFKGVDVPLSHEEQLRYEELLAEEYNRVVGELPEAMKGLNPSQRDEWWSKYRQQIGETARRKLMTEMTKEK